MLHRFTILISNLDDEVAEQVAIKCPDSLSGVSSGQAYVDFARDADSLGAAIDSALNDLNRLGISPQGVQVDELVGAN